jgi:membrane protein required for colicin V production
MNGIDIVLLGILAIALIRGFIKGFIMQLAGLAALILGIYVAIHFSETLGILFALVVLAVHFLGKLVEKLAKITSLSFLNRLAGAFFSALKAIFILAVLATMLNVLDQKIHILPAEKMGNSVFYKPLSNLIPSLFPRIFYKQYERKQTVPEEQIVVTL